MTSKKGPINTLQDFTNPSANSNSSANGTSSANISSSALVSLQLSLFHPSGLHRSLSSQQLTLLPDKPTKESCSIQPVGCENSQEAISHYPSENSQQVTSHYPSEDSQQATSHSPTLPTSTGVLSTAPHSLITTSLLVSSPSPPYLQPAKPFRDVSEGAQLTQANQSTETAQHFPLELHLTDIESASTDLPIRLGCSHDLAVQGENEDRARHIIQRSTSSLQFNTATLHQESRRSAACKEEVSATNDLQCNTSLRSQPPVSNSETQSGAFYLERSTTPIYSRQFSLVDRASRKSPPKKFRSYHSFHSIPPRASSTSATRLPRYLGNHSQARISPLGRSLSLTLPQLRAAYIPRRALSLPRILEHRRSTSSILYIDTRVGNFEFGGRTRVIRRQHSSHRHERKVPIMNPSRMPWTRPSRRQTSQMTTDGTGFAPPDDTVYTASDGSRWIVGEWTQSGTALGPQPVFRPAPPPKDGLWKKVKRALGRVFKKNK